jgi:hypothetical protein
MNKKSKYVVIVNLMCSSGIMLLVSGVPGMLLFGLIEYLTGKMPLEIAAISVGVMVPFIAVTGFILYGLGIHLAKRLRHAKANHASS